MTLRRTIAAALRHGAVSAEQVATERVREWDAAGSATPDRLARLDGIARLAAGCRSIADLLDPRAHPAVADVDVHARGVEPAAPARASVGRVEEAVPPAAADAEHGHAGNGTTFTGLLTVAEHPSLSALEGIAKTAWVTRHVNGWLVNYADADGVTRGLIGPSVREVAAVLALNHRVRARSMHIVKGGRA